MNIQDIQAKVPELGRMEDKQRERIEKEVGEPRVELRHLCAAVVHLEDRLRVLAKKLEPITLPPSPQPADPQTTTAQPTNTPLGTEIRACGVHVVQQIDRVEFLINHTSL